MLLIREHGNVLSTLGLLWLFSIIAVQAKISTNMEGENIKVMYNQKVWYYFLYRDCCGCFALYWHYGKTEISVFSFRFHSILLLQTSKWRTC